MSATDSERPSDTEAAHQPNGPSIPGASGGPRTDPNFANNVEGREGLGLTGRPDRGGDPEPTAGGRVADALPEEAVRESGEDLQIDRDEEQPQ